MSIRHPLSALASLIVAVAVASSDGAQVLYSFEDETTEGWTPSIIDSPFEDKDSQLSAVPGPGNTDGKYSLKVVGRTGGFVRNSTVVLDPDRVATLNQAIDDGWNLAFDWTIVASENPGASGFQTQLSIGSTAGWTQVDMHNASGFPVWDSQGPEVQTITVAVPLSKFGSGELGYNGVMLDSTSTFYFFGVAMSSGDETADMRTYYLDNFRLTANVLGDFNHDEVLDASDIDALTLAVLNNSADPMFDVDKSAIVDANDRVFWVNNLRRTYFGDSNLDGEFNSTDLVRLFTVGEYEDGIAANSGWSDGDWNGDQEFDSGDFVSAFAAGGYEQGPRPAVSIVPEPSSVLILFLWWTVYVRRDLEFGF